MDIEEILAEARLPERTVPLVMRGDLQARWEELDRAFHIADTSIDDDVLAGGSNAKALEVARQMEAVREEMQACTRVFVVRGLPQSQWQALMSKHPPSEEDEARGGDVNQQTFPVAAVAACTIDPEMTVEQTERLRDTVAQGGWNELAAAVFAVNTSTVSVPFSLAASARLAGSAPSSK